MEDRSAAGPGTSAEDEGKSRDRGKAVSAVYDTKHDWYVLSCNTVKSQGCLHFFPFLFDCTVIWGMEVDS